jgi:phage shock protein A
LNMGVFDRFKRIVKGNINSFLDSVEDPERALEQAISDMTRELQKARESLTLAMVNEKKTARFLEAERGEVEKWRQRAAAFLKAGDETLAKETLVRQRTAKELI